MESMMHTLPAAPARGLARDMEYGRACADVLNREVFARPRARVLRDAQRDRRPVVAHRRDDADGVWKRVQTHSHGKVRAFGEGGR
jgi:hypothetical protein